MNIICTLRWCTSCTSPQVVATMAPMGFAPVLLLLLLSLEAYSLSVSTLNATSDVIHRKRQLLRQAVQREQQEDRYNIIWSAPFYAGGGYCSEAMGFTLALGAAHGVQLQIRNNDIVSASFVAGIPPNLKQRLDSLTNTAFSQAEYETCTAICHSVPDGFVPRSARHPAAQKNGCPPSDVMLAVGRSMFETDRVPSRWLDPLNSMDAIWVPTPFNVKTFTEHGVRVPVRAVPETVDCDFYNPAHAHALPIYAEHCPHCFNFLSVFEWAERKGWRFLLQAYLTEFTRAENVVLYIRASNESYTKENLMDVDTMTKWAQKTFDLSPEQTKILPRVVFLSHALPLSDLPALYKGAHALVQPSRGEGWGRPETEAMCMSLPVIATNWSGLSFIIDDTIAYPLAIDKLVPCDTDRKDYQGHMWAQPSVAHLRTLMREVYSDRTGSQRKGALARDTMIKRYSNSAVSDYVKREIQWLSEYMESKEHVDHAAANFGNVAHALLADEAHEKYLEEERSAADAL